MAVLGRAPLRVPRISRQKSILTLCTRDNPKPLGNTQIQRDQVMHLLHGWRWKGKEEVGPSAKVRFPQTTQLCLCSKDTLCNGLNHVPRWCVQVLIAGAYECDLFGNRVFSLAMRLVKMRYWIGVSPKSRDWCPYGERRGHIQGRHLHEDTKEHGRDVETSQGMARIASRLQKPGRDKEGKEGFSPGTFRWIIALLILDLYFPELGENAFCCFRSPSLW